VNDGIVMFCEGNVMSPETFAMERRKQQLQFKGESRYSVREMSCLLKHSQWKGESNSCNLKGKADVL
jgi:hypothetical protein